MHLCKFRAADGNAKTPPGLQLIFSTEVCLVWCCPRNYPRKLCENATQSGLFPRPAQLHIQHSQVHTAGAEQGRPCLGVLRLFGPLYIHIVNVVCPESRPWWYCRYGVML